VRTYRIAPGALSAVETWISQRKAKWISHFDRLEQYLSASQNHSNREKDKP
jgi:hypothetical protein